MSTYGATVKHTMNVRCLRILISRTELEKEWFGDIAATLIIPFSAGVVLIPKTRTMLLNLKISEG